MAWLESEYKDEHAKIALAANVATGLIIVLPALLFLLSSAIIVKEFQTVYVTSSHTDRLVRLYS
jgi:hypothetical protein